MSLSTSPLKLYLNKNSQNFSIKALQAIRKLGRLSCIYFDAWLIRNFPKDPPDRSQTNGDINELTSINYNLLSSKFIGETY